MCILILRCSDQEPVETQMWMLLLLLLLLDAVQGTPPSSLLAVRVALDHPALSSEQRVLCAAACVCRDWRQAVQQCGVRNTHVQFFLEPGS
jgi:hypothetical protein